MTKPMLPAPPRFPLRSGLGTRPTRRFSPSRTLAHGMRASLVLSCLGFFYTLAEFALRIPTLAGFAAVLLLVGRARKNRHASGWTHGTARLAGYADLMRHRLLGKDGLYLGYATHAGGPSAWQALSGLFSRNTPSEEACRQFFGLFKRYRWAVRRQIRLKHFVHLATFAPAGRGKSRRVLFQNLRSYPHSCVVNDPKGELFHETAAIRRRKLGNVVFRLDPFHLLGPHSNTFNPLSVIDAEADDFIEQCRDLANMLVVRTGKEHDMHWLDSCEIVLTAFIAYVCACAEPEDRSFNTIRALLSGRQRYERAVAMMKAVETHYPNYAMIRRQGGSLDWYIEEELSSVLTTVQRYTSFLDSPAVANNLASSSFDPRCLRDGRATIYLILPQDKLETLAPLMRVWLGMILRSITRGVPDENRRVLFLIDEAGHIGNIRILKNAVTLLRGMGVRLWFFYQSLDQLRTSYGEDASTILDNLETQQFFGITNHAIAEEVSKRIGDATIETVTFNETLSDSHPVPDNGNQAGNRSRSKSYSYAETGRRLFKPEELILLPDDVGLLFHRNVPPVLTHLPDCRHTPEFCGDDGIGTPPGLSRRAVLIAALMLVASGYFAILAARSPRLEQRHAAWRVRPSGPPATPWRFGTELRQPPRRDWPEPSIYEVLPTPSEHPVSDDFFSPPTGATTWKGKSLAGRAAETRPAFSRQPMPPSSQQSVPPGTPRPGMARWPQRAGREPMSWERP